MAVSPYHCVVYLWSGECANCSLPPFSPCFAVRIETFFDTKIKLHGSQDVSDVMLNFCFLISFFQVLIDPSKTG